MVLLVFVAFIVWNGGIVLGIFLIFVSSFQPLYAGSLQNDLQKASYTLVL